MPDFGRWTSNGGDPSLNEINRADRFFEALAAKQPAYSTDHAEAELAFLFAELRDDVRDAPVTAPVTTGDAVEALQRRAWPRPGVPAGRFAVVGSVAAAVLCIGGFGTAVYGAGPGDCLYGMRTALFGQQEQTRDDQVSLASAQLQQVQQLIDQGQWEEAQDKLVAVSTTVQGVEPGRAEAAAHRAVECVDLQGGRAGSRGDAAAGRAAARAAVLAADLAAGAGRRGDPDVRTTTTSESPTTSETTTTSGDDDLRRPRRRTTTTVRHDAAVRSATTSTSDPRPRRSRPRRRRRRARPARRASRHRPRRRPARPHAHRDAAEHRATTTVTTTAPATATDVGSDRRRCHARRDAAPTVAQQPESPAPRSPARRRAERPDGRAAAELPACSAATSAPSAGAGGVPQPAAAQVAPVTSTPTRGTHREPTTRRRW